MNSMNRLKMFSLLLTASLLIPATQLHAGYPLSPESKKYIALAAVVGGTVGGIFGYATAPQSNNATPTTLWGKIKAFPWSSVLMPATIGASLGAGVSYFFTYEKSLEWAEKEFASIERDSTYLAAVGGSDDINDLKQVHFRNKFPIASAYNKLSSLYDSLVSVKNELVKVSQSGIDLLVEKSHDCLSMIAVREQEIRAWLLRLKNDPQYIKEMAAKMQIEATERVARATERAAEAIWYNNLARRDYPHYYHNHPIVRPFPYGRHFLTVKI